MDEPFCNVPTHLVPRKTPHYTTPYHTTPHLTTLLNTLLHQTTHHTTLHCTVGDNGDQSNEGDSGLKLMELITKISAATDSRLLRLMMKR